MTRTKWSLFIIILVSAITAIAAIANNPKYSFVSCYFQSPECSSAISNAGMSLFTALAFLAAFEAGIWAKRTFEHERAPVIAIERCRDDCHEPHGDVQYLTIVKDGFKDEPPADQNIRFLSFRFTAQNIGKTALGNIESKMQLKPADGTFSPPVTLRLNALAAGASRHFEIKFADGLLTNASWFEWLSVTGTLPRLEAKDAKSVQVEMFCHTTRLHVPFTQPYSTPKQTVKQARKKPEKPTATAIVAIPPPPVPNAAKPEQPPAPNDRGNTFS